MKLRETHALLRDSEFFTDDSLDAKRYFLRPAAHWYDAAGTELLATRHKLDPWVLSAGVAYRF